jgi:hypothetical protein
MRALGTILLAVVVVAACGADGPSEAAALEPIVDCAGVPAERCQSAVVEAMAEPGNRPHVRAITVRCTAPSCTIQEGQMAVTVLLDDGSRITSGSGWAAAAPGVPAPDRGTVDVVLPVKPICIGVPPKACEQFAKSSLDGLGARPLDTIVSIVVRCGAGAPCIETRGSGSTDLTFRDGTRQTSDWVYEGAISP